MVALADIRETTPGSRPPSLARALRSVGFGLVIGLSIALLRRQNVAYTLIYSICIALTCWFCIDLGRHLVAGRFKSTATADRGGPHRRP